MATAAEWIEGARPRTLGAAVAPIAVGTGVAAAADALQPVRALLALIVMRAAQIGVNYANDYSDGVRGTDQSRVGPVRLVGQGLAAPRQVRLAALASLGVCAIVGLLLVALTGGDSGKGKTTALQDMELAKIREAGGTALVINEENIELVKQTLKELICE